jgi:hypothetical protein
MLSTRSGFLSVEEKKITKAGSSARQKYVTFYAAVICWTIKYAGCAELKHLLYIDKHTDITQSPARVWYTQQAVKMYGGVEVKIQGSGQLHAVCVEKQTAASPSHPFVILPRTAAIAQ